MASVVRHEQGHVVMSQMLHKLGETSVKDILQSEYQRWFGLTDAEVDIVAEHMSRWSVLRKCCGCQQSLRHRKSLLRGLTNASSQCEGHNISVLEREFLATRLSQLYSNELFSLYEWRR